jgi:hypothetical protein
MILHAGGPFAFAQLGSSTCSICAPETMSQTEIELVAGSLVSPGVWRAIDKSQPPISMGAKTPNPCAHDPSRLHWFLISDELHTKLGGNKIVRLTE